jgi:uncharacterized protein YjgD (DUF1641 family)
MAQTRSSSRQKAGKHASESYQRPRESQTGSKEEQGSIKTHVEHEDLLRELGVLDAFVKSQERDISKCAAFKSRY